MLKREEFQEAMARFAGAVTIVTTREDDQLIGMVATSVCSLSADPPSLVACINKGTSAHDPILKTRTFAVSLLSDDQDLLVRHFMSAKGAQRFSKGTWDTLVTGSPVVQGAIAVFDCELLDSYDGFSHTILIGKIVDMRLSENAGAASCLLWHKRDFAKVALHSQRELTP